MNLTQGRYGQRDHRHHVNLKNLLDKPSFWRRAKDWMEYVEPEYKQKKVN